MRSGVDKIVKLESKYLRIFDWIDEKVMVLKVSSFDPGNVAELICEYEEKSILIKLGEDNWSMPAYPDIKLTQRRINQLLGLLGTVSFSSDISSISRVPGDESMTEQGRYILKDRAGEPIDEIVFYTVRTGEGSASSSKSGAYGSVDINQFNQIQRYIFDLTGSSR